jgi:hypothetical protein
VPALAATSTFLHHAKQYFSDMRIAIITNSHEHFSKMVIFVMVMMIPVFVVMIFIATRTL